VGRKSWKADERMIARRLHGERVPVTGRVRGFAPDVNHSWMALEVKSRKSMLKIINEMMLQAEAARDWFKRKSPQLSGKLPVGVYHVTGTHFDNAFVFMRLRDFEDWFVGDFDAKYGGDET
jgi:hypothetical protein